MFLFHLDSGLGLKLLLFHLSAVQGQLGVLFYGYGFRFAGNLDVSISNTRSYRSCSTDVSPAYAFPLRGSIAAVGFLEMKSMSAQPNYTISPIALANAKYNASLAIEKTALRTTLELFVQPPHNSHHLHSD